jgi:predicted dehydrogenase
MLNVGIIGCGKMADQHAAQLLHLPNVRIVAVCDSEVLLARQMSERYGRCAHFTDARQMLESERCDVLHITTPPATHFPLARLCLNAGCHVYVEKPFTLNAAEASELIALAERGALKLTAGHNAQFTPAMQRMRQLVREGFLGGSPVHMESIHCYDLGDATYARALLGDASHWVRRLPGSLLQNLISHGIAKIAEFLVGKSVEVRAQAFTSDRLIRAGQGDIRDELRVVIRDERGASAYFTFSSQIRPAIHQFRLYGPKSSLIVDDDHQLVLKGEDRGYRSYLRYLLPPARYATQVVRQVSVNCLRIGARDLQLPFDAGLRALIQAFHAACIGEGPVPIAYNEILLTARMMDEIFRQVSAPATATGAAGSSKELQVS